MKKKLTPANNPDDPRIKEICKALEKNPDLQSKRILIGYSVGGTTLEEWVRKGWVPAPKRQLKVTTSHYWRTSNGELFRH